MGQNMHEVKKKRQTS